MTTSAKAQLMQPLTNETSCTFKIRIAWLNTMSVQQQTLFTIAPNSVNEFTLPANAATITQGRLYTTGGTTLSAWFALPGFHESYCPTTNNFPCASCSLGWRIDTEPIHGILIRCGQCP